MRIELLNALTSFFAALFVVVSRDNLSPSFGGAALNFALSSGGIVGFAIILATELEVQMNAVERTQHYTHNIAQEVGLGV